MSGDKDLESGECQWSGENGQLSQNFRKMCISEISSYYLDVLVNERDFWDDLH